jgi:hypothetical protein
VWWRGGARTRGSSGVRSLQARQHSAGWLRARQRGMDPGETVRGGGGGAYDGTGAGDGRGGA